MNDRELMEQVEVVAYRISHPLAQWNTASRAKRR